MTTAYVLLGTGCGLLLLSALKTKDDPVARFLMGCAGFVLILFGLGASQ